MDKAAKISELLVCNGQLSFYFEGLVRYLFELPDSYPLPGYELRRYLIHLLIDGHPFMARLTNCDISPNCECFYCRQPVFYRRDNYDSDPDADALYGPA